MSQLESVQQFSKEDWQRLKKDEGARREIARKSFYWFFHLYFESYIEYPTAPFQKEMIDAVSNPDVSQLAVMAFRGSGKSAILNTAYAIWSIIGEQQKKFVLIVSLNQSLANQHLGSIAKALEESELLKADFWPYNYENNETTQSVIRLPKYDARILAVGREQALRGLRHGAHRPDVIIADDTEDIASTVYQQSRDTNFKWYNSELMGLGDEKTKFITIGNMIHPDATIMRLKRDMEAGVRDGKFLFYPVEKDGISLWPARFPTPESIKKLQKRIGDPVAYQREYMLNYVADANNIVKREDIQYYDKIPPLLRGEQEHVIIGVDPAISNSKTADYTAMVTITVRGSGDKAIYYIHPRPVNRRMDITQIHAQLDSLAMLFKSAKFYIESVAFQLAIVQSAQQRGLNVDGVNSTSKKEDRLNMIAYRISQGNILFPKTGAEDLITQLVDYPAVAHDDLMDALTIPVINYSLEKLDEKPGRAVFVKGPHIVDVSLAARRRARRF